MMVLGAQEELGGHPQHVARRERPSRRVESHKTALEIARNTSQTQLLFFPHLGKKVGIFG